MRPPFVNHLVDVDRIHGEYRTRFFVELRSDGPSAEATVRHDHRRSDRRSVVEGDIYGIFHG
jgi:hypothetical protein